MDPKSPEYYALVEAVGERLRPLKVLAMHAVVESPLDYNLRYIFRWYSQTFNTPLTEVEELPLEDVLQHYWESQYEELEDEAQAEEITRLLMPEEKLKRLRREEDAEDAEAFEFGREAEAEAPTMAPVKVTANDPIQERMDAFREALKPPSDVQYPPEVAPRIREPFLEGISMTFDDVNDDADDRPGFGPPDKKPGNL